MFPVVVGSVLFVDKGGVGGILPVVGGLSRGIAIVVIARPVNTPVASNSYLVALSRSVVAFIVA